MSRGKVAAMGRRVVIDQDPGYAPCSYLVCEVDGRGEWDTRDEERTVLVATDWDFPSLAGNVGFVPCDCGETDGTVDCPHHTASQMIAGARDWLNDHLGEPFEDPGYFGS